MADVEITVLGPLAITVDGGPLDLGKPQAQLVLAHLLSRSDRHLRRDELIERIWPNRDPRRAGHSLNVHVSEIRKRLPAEVGVELETTQEGYRLKLPEGTCDRDRFERLVEEQRFGEALDVWTGRAYAGFSDQVGIRQSAASLESKRRDVLATWAESALASGHEAKLIDRLEAGLAIDPFDERLSAQLMKAYYGSGAPAKALAVFRRMRRLLGEELGVEPGPELQDLEEQVLLHDPRLRSLDRTHPASTRLPIERTELIGRALDVAGVLDRLDTSRIVTILGPGGAGKTRLALRVAHSLVDRQVTVYFAGLGGLTTPDQVVGALVASMGIADTRGISAEDTLHRALAHSNATFVVDNCEHVIAGAADAIDGLVTRCPELRVLTTSREPLNVAGETIWQLGTLAVPPDDRALDFTEFEAVRLFIDRARSRLAGFDPQPHLDVIAGLVRRLDGLPLAIELAAALVPTMSPSEIETALGDGIEVLDHGLRTGPTRHRSLEEAVTWSEHLMSEDERILFRRLSVFAGRFGVDAPSTVCSFGELEVRPVRRTLARLVEKSIVNADTASTETSFRLLETVRAVGRDRLDEALETQETVRRYLEYYQGKAREYGWLASSERRDEALRWTTREFDNIADVVGRLHAIGDHGRLLEIAASLARVVTAMGRYRTVVDWIELGLTPTTLPVDANVVAQARVVMAMAGAERPGSAEAGEAAYDHFCEAGIHAGAARAAYALAHNASLRRDVVSAERWSSLAVEHARKSGSDATLAWVLPLNVVYRLVEPQRELGADEIASAIADLDAVEELIASIDNAELPIAAAVGRIAVRVILGDHDPFDGVQLPPRPSEASYYLPVVLDIMCAAAAITTDDLEDGLSRLLAVVEPLRDSLQLEARRSMLKIFAGCAVKLALWDVAARLFGCAGDGEPVLVYGLFFDPRPLHLEMRNRLGDRADRLLEAGGALDVDDAIDLFVDAATPSLSA